MEDVAAGLKSLSFESGLGAEEKELLHLRARAAGLAFCRCAHALYLCELVRSLRLAELLGHNFILKPQYDFVGGDTADVWLSCTAVSTALKDPLLIDASCPLAMSGGISLSLNWACAVLYTLLNICTSASLRSSDALSLINELFQEKWMHAVQLNTESFISSSYAASLRGDEPFPWISLTEAQTKETPLLRFLSSNKLMQQCFSAAYKSLLVTPATVTL
ncbi:hypothetical protein F2P81_003583 [Scophthalmus maximus]|uniref:Uncharacterized protein n=1 Tax=Scophthalmus maximus TaxID=52904 RepID=A0A6A4TGU5_SCOMX|nr:hypothetical protein F2P81_003583 [Scophthalmus maximus]